MELRRQEAVVRQLNRQLQQVEKEKDGLQRKVDDAENALRKAIKDRDVLTKYITNVEYALEAVCLWSFRNYITLEFCHFSTLSFLPNSNTFFILSKTLINGKRKPPKY